MQLSKETALFINTERVIAFIKFEEKWKLTIYFLIQVIMYIIIIE